MFLPSNVEVNRHEGILEVITERLLVILGVKEAEEVP